MNTIRTSFFALIMALISFVANSQSDFGKWTLHPIFAGDNITNCIDTGDKVYYLASGNLFRYDKDTQENEHMNRSNYLNDNGVRNIYYNYNKKYLMIAYENANIDIIDEKNGDIYNMSDIRDANISYSKGINDITFATGNRAVVATDFGFVILNDNKHEVISSLITGTSINSAAIMGYYLIVSYNGSFYYAPATKHVQQMGDFTKASGGGNGTMFPIDDNHFFALTSNALKLFTITASGDALTFNSSQIAQGKPLSVQQLQDGGFVASFKNTDYYYTTNETGDNATRHDGSGIYSSHEASGNWWVLTASGLSHITGDTQSEPMKPNAISISTTPYWMDYNVAQEKLYLASTTDNVLLPTANEGGKTEVNTWDGMTWTDITPDDIPQPDEGCYWPVFSGSETNTYFLSLRKLGILKIANNKIVSIYNPANCGITNRMAALRVDSQGNLWLIQSRDEANPVRALTPTKQALAEIKATDFVTNHSSHLQNIYAKGFKRSQFIIGAADTKVFTSGEYQSPLVIWNNNNDLSLAHSRSFSIGELTDQDGKSLQWGYIKAFAVDNNGLIWMQTSSGMIAFNPSKAFDADFRVTHIKVPRNDGTNLADYLLDGQSVNCIAVDGANRKWIGTEASGLFLVSADGQTVLKNFNASNSVMGSNQIYQVCCDKTSNSVFVTTPLGVAEYKSDATPGQTSFSNIYAYPNPVRPDYGGPINITGLMENSLVKIADPSGNVVRSLKSTGGMVSWDGCNYNGDPVATGVYTILASQADGSSGATTKVLIVR